MQPNADISLWVAYINFVQKELRDVGSARANFEKCRQLLAKDSSRLADLV